MGLLQCGHGLAAVENGDAVNELSRLLKLQCGHGLAAVENTSTRGGSTRA